MDEEAHPVTTPSMVSDSPSRGETEGGWNSPTVIHRHRVTWYRRRLPAWY